MIYEKFPQLHSLSAADKTTLANELLQEAAKPALEKTPPFFLGRDPARYQKLQPDWKNKERKAGT